MNESLRLFVQKIKKLPTIPLIAHKILNLVSSDTTSVGKLEAIIQEDPAISAKILSFANTAFFGRSSPNSTIANAIQKIGFNNVRNIAMGISLMTIFDDKDQDYAFDYHKLYCHSIAVGVLAKKLSAQLNINKPEENFLSGILHDLGYLLLNRYFPAVYMKIIAAVDKGKEPLAAELEILGFTHADVGAWLADTWNLPGNIWEAILHHHMPSLAKKNIKQAAVVHLADYIVIKRFFSPYEKCRESVLDPAVFDILDIKKEFLDELMEGVDESMFTSGAFAE